MCVPDEDGNVATDSPGVADDLEDLSTNFLAMGLSPGYLLLREARCIALSCLYAIISPYMVNSVPTTPNTTVIRPSTETA